MQMTTGRNTFATAQLIETIEKVEALDKEIDALKDDRKVIMTGAAAAGFVAKWINFCVKVRKTKPHDFQDHESTRDLYLHAIKMGEQLPLFRQFEGMMDETVGQSQALALLEQIVPRNGSMLFERDGEKPIRISRDKDGKVTREVVDKAAERAERKTTAAKTRREDDDAPPPPKCTEAEALELGEAAYKDNKPITENPFPFGDKRRPKWDKGWRKASGTDGMGEDDDE